MIQYVLLAVGATVMFFGAVGVIRFPDVYTRLHASTKCDTGGAMAILLALALHVDATLLVRLKFLILIFLIAIINPMISHAIAKGAYQSGVEPEVGVDDYAGDRS
ncbi:cation:proton antiporter [candidate division MSBL1 archaeon SCGC-AAA259I09]|uniref:Cation:proton antiporter n=3 Tax=candidate division MSBL1 TaxID=215777 RepID=A0A133UQN6_9EURY|nr:cation:proton antiporter [candidate division MSBL1 archaeon SCGC-AAA259D14]KXA93378.1 cation:proton antiporter [candidate division MSBL1 archaeon SCGC-AAA259E22]KXA96447.1 cation:proton antiporter [candidate division MSBL1 archaeon SCGC-AAA259I09]